VPERTVNEIRLYFEERGKGRSILLIHGTASSAMVWTPSSLDALADLGRVIVYDRRGCTRSERPERYETTTVSEHADDAAALLEALDAAPAVVIGRSYGGEVAIDVALRYPDLVRALVLLEAAVLNLSPEARAWEDGVHERIRAAAARGIDTVGETFIGDILGADAWRGLPRRLRQMFTENGPAIVAELEGGPLNVDITRLRSIDAPTLLVASSGSPPAFRQATDRLAAAMPNAQRVTIEGDHRVDPGDASVIAFVRRALG